MGSFLKFTAFRRWNWSIPSRAAPGNHRLALALLALPVLGVACAASHPAPTTVITVTAPAPSLTPPNPPYRLRINLARDDPYSIADGLCADDAVKAGQSLVHTDAQGYW